jgi:hypothetical protein
MEVAEGKSKSSYGGEKRFKKVLWKLMLPKKGLKTKIPV